MYPTATATESGIKWPARVAGFDTKGWRVWAVTLGRTEGGLVAVRALRGAIQVSANERQPILDGAGTLVQTVLDRNGVRPEDIISIVFTATPDLTAEFPAYAARQLGLSDVPLLCATEIDVPGAMPRVLRLLAHVSTDRARSELRHVYLDGAAELRTDLPR